PAPPLRPPHQRSTRVPYTTLFRSRPHRREPGVGDAPHLVHDAVNAAAADRDRDLHGGGRYRPPPWRGWCRSTRRRSATAPPPRTDRKSTRLNSSHSQISYAVFCLK